MTFAGDSVMAINARYTGIPRADDSGCLAGIQFEKRSLVWYPILGNGQNNGQQNGHLAVPEELNPVWMLLPISGVVMLLSWRRISRAKT